MVSKKTALPAIGIIAVVVLFTIGYFIPHSQVSAPTDNNRQQEQSQEPDFKGDEEALKNALNLYIQKKQEGVDMTSGPCFGIVAPDWVLDIAHNPRQPIDNDPKNQCEDFRTGKANHFIELDENGELIQAK